jgi:predicted ferric reductase
MALGFSGMTMVSVLFLLTARLRHLTAPFGVDIIYYFHRYLALVAITLIFLHYLIIRISYADALGVLNPMQASAYMSAARVAVFLFILIAVTSLWRKRLRIHYDEWRLMHVLLAITAFLLVLIHINGVGYYINAHSKRLLWGGYILFWVLLIVYVRLIKPWRMYKQPYRVAEVREERGNCWTLVLQPHGHEGVVFKPGQFAWLTVGESPWNIKEHPFSFSASADQHQLEFTIKELGDFTRTIKDLRIGELAYLDGPYGVFSVDYYPDSPGFVFIAGGVGVAPIMSMLRTLADRHERRQLWFLYAANNWQDVLFREELKSLENRLNLNLVYVLNDASASWKGETGFITTELLQKHLSGEAKKYEYFLCGPKPMSEAVQLGLYRLRVPMKQIHFELFDMV